MISLGKKQKGRIIVGRRRRVEGGVQAVRRPIEVDMGDWGYFGNPELLGAILSEPGAVEALGEYAREVCPICSAGLEHKH